MPASTPFLGLYKPGGGSSGLITPDEVVDIDRLNTNADLIDASAGQMDTRLDTLEANTGLVLLKPTTVVGGIFDANTGLISANAGVNTISVNGVFSADYRNYRLMYASAPTSGGAGLDFRFRSAGVDEAAAAYRWQSVFGANSVQQEIGSNDNKIRLSSSAPASLSGFADIFGPMASGVFKGVVAQNAMMSGTAFSLVAMGGGITVNKPFDGFSLIITSGTFDTVNTFIKVYGYK